MFFLVYMLVNYKNIHYRHCYISKISDQNGVCGLYIMLEIYHSGRKPLMCELKADKLTSNHGGSWK